MSDEAAAAPKKKGGKMKKLIFFVLLPVILIGGGIGAGVYAAGMFGGHHEKAKVDPDAPKLLLKEHKEGPTELPAGKHPDPEIYKSTYYPLEQPFTSNLSDSDGYVQLGLGVSTFYDQKVLDNLKNSDMPVRSAVLEVLSQQSADTINTPQGKTALRQQLRIAINRVLQQREGFGGVDDVYFTSFVIQ